MIPVIFRKVSGQRKDSKECFKIEFDQDTDDEAGRSYELSCTDTSHTMKIAGKFNFDLQSLKYDCDARQGKRHQKLF